MAAMRPQVIVHPRQGSDSMWITIEIYNTDFTYYDERGSKLTAPCTSITLRVSGIDPWIEIGLFTQPEENDQS